MKHAFLFTALLASSMAYAGSSLDTQAVQLNLLSGNIHYFLIVHLLPQQYLL